MTSLTRPTAVVAALVLTLTLAFAAPGAAQTGAVSLCTSQVDIDWQDLYFDPDDTDATKANWFVGTVATATTGTDCAGVPQALTLLDDDGTVVYEGRTVLDDDGNGRYEDVAVRAEDVWSVQVLLHEPGDAPEGTPSPPPDGNGDGTEPDAGTGSGDGTGPGGIAGALPTTGWDPVVAVALALALLAAGTLLHRRRAAAP